MPKGTVASVCDQHCKGCVYFYEYGETSSLKVCEYMFQTGNRRPCHAGKGCTVRATKKGRTMAQRMEADAYSYLARKEAQDKLSVDMRQCDQDGAGVSYGKWKAAQPQVQYAKAPKEGLKACLWCGKMFKPKMPYAKYCCPDCRNAAYSRNSKYVERKRAYQAKRREKKRKERICNDENESDA